MPTLGQPDLQAQLCAPPPLSWTDPGTREAAREHHSRCASRRACYWRSCRPMLSCCRLAACWRRAAWRRRAARSRRGLLCTSSSTLLCTTSASGLARFCTRWASPALPTPFAPWPCTILPTASAPPSSPPPPPSGAASPLRSVRPVPRFYTPRPSRLASPPSSLPLTPLDACVSAQPRARCAACERPSRAARWCFPRCSKRWRRWS